MEILDDRFQLQDCLGRGGHGSVWSATDRHTGAQVAVKRLSVVDASSRESTVERFRREAEVTAVIRHPNVVRIEHVGTIEETDEIYLVMELLRGHTLSDAMQAEGRISATRAVPLILGALSGLAEAHRRGIVHKDLKPDNLFIEEIDGTEKLKVIDFGIARMDSLDRLTRTGRIVGTPRYLAPEYIRSSDVSPRTDVYQMGLILAETVTGQSPVPKGLGFFPTLQRHVHGELEFPAWFRGLQLGQVILKATALDPEDRYENAAELCAAIENITEEWNSEHEAPDFDELLVRNPKDHSIGSVRMVEFDSPGEPANLELDLPEPRAPRSDTERPPPPQRGRSMMPLAVVGAMFAPIVAVGVWLSIGGGSPDASEGEVLASRPDHDRPTSTLETSDALVHRAVGSARAAREFSTEIALAQAKVEFLTQKQNPVETQRPSSKRSRGVQIIGMDSAGPADSDTRRSTGPPISKQEARDLAKQGDEIRRMRSRRK